MADLIHVDEPMEPDPGVNLRCLYCQLLWPEDQFPKRSALCYNCKARKMALLRAVKSKKHVAIWHEVSLDTDLMRTMTATYTSDPTNFSITSFLLNYLEAHPERRMYYSRALQLIADVGVRELGSGGSSWSPSSSSSGGAPPPPPPPPPLALPMSESESDSDAETSSQEEELVGFRFDGAFVRRVRRRRH